MRKIIKNLKIKTSVLFVTAVFFTVSFSPAIGTNLGNRETTERPMPLGPVP